MLINNSPAPQRAHIPIADLIHAMDSETTAATLDQVDVGKFQGDKVFTRENAHTLATLATVAYSTPEDQKAHMDKQKGVRLFKTLDSADNEKLGIPQKDTGTNLTLVETDNALIVAARGTQAPWINNDGKENEFTWKDLASDLNTVPVKNYDGSAKVHQGFKDQADGIWTQLQPYLNQAKAAHKAIHFTGHSLGAAVALQLADRYLFEYKELPQSVVRFGGPEIGWDEEQKHLEKSGLAKRTVNVENSGDPVPLALPGGETAGEVLYFDRNGKAELKGGSHLVDRLLGKGKDLVSGHLFIPMYRHFPQFYLMGLEDERNVKTLTQLEQRMNEG